jgi:hypothetical protein
MSRPSLEVVVTEKVTQYIREATQQHDKKMPLSALGVAKAIGHDRRVLKKYGLDVMIADAAAKRRKHHRGVRRTMDERIAAAEAQCETLRCQVNALLSYVALMEGNAKRLGFDPEELYIPLKPPDRSAPATRKRRGARA